MGERALSPPSPRAFLAFLFTPFDWLNDFSPLSWEPGTGYHHVQISSIYWKTAAKAWNCYQRWLCRNGTRISFCNISSGKTGPPFQVFRCSSKFSVGKRTQKVVFHLLSVRISRKVFVNGGCQEPIKIWWAPVVVNHLQKFPSPSISNTPPPPVPLSLGRKLFLLSHRSF